MGQLAPVVVGTGATYAGIKWAQEGGKETAKEVAKAVTPTPPATPAQIAAGAPASSGTAALPTAPQMNINGAPQYPGGANYPAIDAPAPVLPDGTTNTLPPGAEVTENGEIISAETGATIGRVAQGALGAYQIYEGIGDFKDDKIGGSLGVASGAAQVGSALGYESAGAYAAPLLAAKGGYDLYNSFQNGGEGVRGASTTLGAGIGSFAGPVGTVVGAGIGNLAGYGLQGDGFKNDLALGAMTGGVGLIPGVGDSIRGLMHKTTKQHQSEKWSEMAESDDPATAAYAKQYLDTIAQGDGSGITFEQIQEKADKSGRDVWGASAFFDAFKDKGGWLNSTEQQREAIAKRALDEGLLRGSHGDIIAIDDTALDRIRQIGEENGFSVTNPKQASPAMVAAGAPPRSTTSSPGMMNGVPIPVKKLNPSFRR